MIHGEIVGLVFFSSCLFGGGITLAADYLVLLVALHFNVNLILDVYMISDIPLEVFGSATCYQVWG